MFDEAFLLLLSYFSVCFIASLRACLRKIVNFPGRFVSDKSNKMFRKGIYSVWPRARLR